MRAYLRRCNGSAFHHLIALYPADAHNSAAAQHAPRPMAHASSYRWTHHCRHQVFCRVTHHCIELPPSRPYPPSNYHRAIRVDGPESIENKSIVVAWSTGLSLQACSCTLDILLAVVAFCWPSGQSGHSKSSAMTAICHSVAVVTTILRLHACPALPM